MNEVSRQALILCLLLGLPLLALSGARLPRHSNSPSIAVVPAPRTIAEPVERPTTSVATAATNARPDITQQPWFDATRRQLQGLGAVYIRLERWEGVCPVYQFRCDLEHESESESRTSIEAFSGSAQIATEYVVLAARQWRHRVSSPSAIRQPAATVPRRDRLGPY